MYAFGYLGLQSNNEATLQLCNLYGFEEIWRQALGSIIIELGKVAEKAGAGHRGELPQSQHLSIQAMSCCGSPC